MSKKLKKYQKTGEVKLTFKEWCSQNGDLCSVEAQKAEQLYKEYSKNYDLKQLDIGFNFDIGFNDALESDTSPEAEEAQYNKGPQMNQENLNRLLSQQHVMLPAVGDNPLLDIAGAVVNTFRDVRDVFREPTQKQIDGYNSGEYVVDPILYQKSPNNPNRYLVPYDEYHERYVQDFFDRRAKKYPNRYAKVDFDLDDYNETGNFDYIGDPLPGDIFEMEYPHADVINWGDDGDIISWGEYDDEGELVITPYGVEEVIVEEEPIVEEQPVIPSDDDEGGYGDEEWDEEKYGSELPSFQKEGEKTEKDHIPTDEGTDQIMEPTGELVDRELHHKRLKNWYTTVPDDYEHPTVVIDSNLGRSYYEPHMQTIYAGDRDIDRVGWHDLMSHELTHHIQNLEGKNTYHGMMKHYFPHDTSLHWNTYKPKPVGPVEEHYLRDYYDRRAFEKGVLMNQRLEKDPYAKLVQGLVWDQVEDEIYNHPWTIEGEAMDIEDTGGFPLSVTNKLREEAIINPGSAYFRDLKYGGSLPILQNGGDGDGLDLDLDDSLDDSTDWIDDLEVEEPDWGDDPFENADPDELDDEGLFIIDEEPEEEEDIEIYNPEDDEYNPQTVDPPEEYNPQSQDDGHPLGYDDDDDLDYDNDGVDDRGEITDGGWRREDVDKSGGRKRSGDKKPFWERKLPKAFYKLSHGLVSIAKPLNKYLARREAKKQKRNMDNAWLADNMFTTTAADLSGSRGDYDTNTGIFRPDDKVISRMGKYGMEIGKYLYKTGGQLPKAQNGMGMEYYKNNYPGYDQLSDSEKRQLDYQFNNTTYDFYEDLFNFQNPMNRTGPYSKHQNTMSYPFPEWMRHYDNHPGQDDRGNNWLEHMKDYEENPNYGQYYNKRWSTYGDWDTGKGWDRTENRKQGLWGGHGTTVTDPITGEQVNQKKGPWEGYYSGYQWMTEDPISVSEEDWNILVDAGYYNPRHIDKRGKWSNAKHDYINRHADKYMTWENILRKYRPELTTMQIHDLMWSGVHRTSMRGGRQGSPWAAGIPTPARMKEEDYRWGEYGELLGNVRDVMPPFSHGELPTNTDDVGPNEYPPLPDPEPIVFDHVEDPFNEFDDEIIDIEADLETEEEIDILDTTGSGDYVFESDGDGSDDEIIVNDSDVEYYEDDEEIVYYDTDGDGTTDGTTTTTEIRDNRGEYDPSSRNDYDYTPQTSLTDDQMDQIAYGDSGAPQSQEYEPQVTSGTDEYIPQTVTGTDEYEPQTQADDEEDDSTDAKYGGQFFNTGGEAEIDINMYKQLIAAGADIEIL